MENQQYYIKYLTSGPVKVETHYIGEQIRKTPLSAAGDLITAFQALPNSPLASAFAGDLTLHSINNGLETSYNSRDPLTALGENGKTGTYPLIVKSKNDVEVDSSPATVNKKIILTDGIDINTEHLKRPELLKHLTYMINTFLMVRLTAPHASGKSSLMQMYQDSVKGKNFIWISCLESRNLNELLLEQGIDFCKKVITEKLARKRTVVVLDDAQAKYEDLTFWRLLVKFCPIWIPSNVQFIISSTHPPFGKTFDDFNPVGYLPEVDRKKFVLDQDEANEFLEMSVLGLPQKMKSETVKQVIIRECGGLIGALRLSVDSLKNRFAEDANPSETDLLQYFLSNDILEKMNGCLVSAPSHPIGNDFKNLLVQIMVNKELHLGAMRNQQDLDYYLSLKNAGILGELSGNTRFSSPLAKRYYFNWMFPNRSLTNPSSLSELIKNVIGNMSATIIKNFTKQGEFPKGVVFHQLFMEGLAQFTTSDCCICLEVSTVFPAGIQQTIPGEIAFYLNGDLHWGIELLVNGGDIGEHIDRFASPNGKYVALGVRDYAVVDFRGNPTDQPTNVLVHSNRNTVFFKQDDYSIARCYFGDDANIVEISLSN